MFYMFSEMLMSCEDEPRLRTSVQFRASCVSEEGFLFVL